MTQNASTEEIIRIDKAFTVGFETGRINIYKNDQLISERHQQANKAIISAAYEIEALCIDVHAISKILNGIQLTQALAVALDPETDFAASVHIERAKYTFEATQDAAGDATKHSILRHMNAWLTAGELEQPEFWFALASGLQKARQWANALKAIIRRDGIVLGFELQSDQY